MRQPYMITVVGQEISIGINNAMVLSNDLTLTERQLKCLLFGIIASEASFLVCSMVRIFYIFIIYNYVSGRTSCSKCSKRDPYSIYDVTGYTKNNHNYVICIYICMFPDIKSIRLINRMPVEQPVVRLINRLSG